MRDCVFGQVAIVDYAVEISPADRVHTIGYTFVYPIACHGSVIYSSIAVLLPEAILASK